MKVSTTSMPSMKSVHDWSQGISQNCTKGNIWTSSNGFLDCYGAEGDHFLERIVNGDETWTHHYEPESKHQNMERKHGHSPTKKKFETHSTAGKIMLTVFGALPREGLSNEQSSLQGDELSLQFEANEEDCCQKAL